MEWQYIPYSLYNSKGKGGGHYSLRKAFSYNTSIIIIIGARGTGKTFDVKEFITKDFIYNNRKFAWVRDTVEAKDELCDNDGVKFYEDFPLMNLPEFQSGIIKKSEFIINNKRAGVCLPASVFQRFKGNSYQSVTNIVYDEFIREKGRIINKNNLWATVNTFSTIARKRDDVRIFMLANALDKGDEFLEFIGVDLVDFGFYINRKKSICLHYADNTAEFNESNSKGVVGRLIMDTPLADNIMQSNFLIASDLIFNKLPPKSKLLFILETPLQSARFYANNGKLYVTPDVNKETYKNKRYVLDFIHATRTKPVLSLYHKNAIKENLKNNNIVFQNNYLHKFILSCI